MWVENPVIHNRRPIDDSDDGYNEDSDYAYNNDDSDYYDDDSDEGDDSDDEGDEDVWGGPIPIQWIEVPATHDQDPRTQARLPPVETDDRMGEDGDEDEDDGENAWGGPSPVLWIEVPATHDQDHSNSVGLNNPVAGAPRLQHIRQDSPRTQARLPPVETDDRMDEDGDEDEDDGEDAWGGPAPVLWIEVPASHNQHSLHGRSVGGPAAEKTELQLNPSLLVDEPQEPPPFNRSALLQQLGSSQAHHPSGTLTTHWGAADYFLKKRYGFDETSEGAIEGTPDTWVMILGIKKGTPSRYLVQLYESFIAGVWPEVICDLSPDLAPTSHFPARSPKRAINIAYISLGYVLTLVRDVDWKILIKDSLTILQIEREGWDSRPENLVSELVMSGVPFQILHSHTLEDGGFYQHSGPVIHPTGTAPNHIDYLAYRQELPQFSKTIRMRMPLPCPPVAFCGGSLWMSAHHLKSKTSLAPSIERGVFPSRLMAPDIGSPCSPRKRRISLSEYTDGPFVSWCTILHGTLLILFSFPG